MALTSDGTGLSREERRRLRAARDDVGVFAELLVGEPLWPHQLDAARSEARIRVLRAGRQVGKSRLLAILALHEAFRGPNRHVLLLSASDDNAKDLLAEVASLATGSPFLAGSVEDEQASKVTLDNGSWIRSIPASPKQARGKSIDLLILDEAAFISEDVWRAAKYSQAARPGSRLLLSSSPYGRRDAFFAVHDRLGEGGPNVIGGVSVESFVWPSTVSPLVKAAGLVEFWRETDPPRTFAAEVLAEWQDEQGAFFSSAELEAATRDFPLVPPSGAMGLHVSAGIDWGQRDANAATLLGRLDGLSPLASGRECLLGGGGGRPGPLFPAHVVERFGSQYSAFIEEVVDLEAAGRGFSLGSVFSEQNGVGAMPTEVLRRRLGEVGSAASVVGVHTDNRSKEDGFGAMKLLMQRGELVLPRSYPALLRQLAALEFETLDSGSVRIAVPERAGHDDVAMSCMLALGEQVEAALSWRAPMRHSGDWMMRNKRTGVRRRVTNEEKERHERYRERGWLQVDEQVSFTPLARDRRLSSGRRRR